MPLLEAVTSFYEQEWHHFMAGLHGLTPAGQEEARLRAYRFGRVPGQPRSISIPGWDDAIVVRVPEPIPADFLRAHYRALAAGQPSPLTPEQLQNLDERVARAQRIATSAVPEYVQALGQVLQAVDAVQRSLVELAVAGRLALWPIRAGLETLLPAAAGAAAAELGLGARIGLRLLGPIGWIITAADVLSLLFFLGQTLLPLYALLCRSPAEALAAAAAGVASGGIPVRRLRIERGAPANSLKGRAEALASLNPFSTEMRALADRKALRLLPSLHEGIKGFHLGHEATGYGLAFGAIFGFYAEAAYGAALAAQGEPVTVRTPSGLLSSVGVAAGWIALQRESLPLAAFAGGTYLFHQLGRYSGAELKAKQDAARLLQLGPTLNGVQEVFTEEEHAQALCALIYAADLVSEDFIDQPWDDDLDAYVQRPFGPPVTMDALTADTLQRQHVPVDSLNRWALPGAPATTTIEALTTDALTRVPRGIEQLLEPRRNDLSGQFLGNLLAHLRDRLYRLYIGNGYDVQRRWTPEWRFIISLARHERIPIVASPYEPILEFWNRGVEGLRAKEKTGYFPDELDQLYSATGVPYIQAG